MSTVSRTSNLTYAVEAIKSSISMPKAIAHYAPNPAPKHDRIPCPVHNGKGYNMWFSEWGYHCFVCGTSGDVIHFVQHIFGMTFQEAVEKLNQDFGLGIPMNRRLTLREQREAQQRHNAVMAEREREEAEQKARQDLYNALWDEWARLDQNRRIYAPQRAGDEIHPFFAEALQKIDYQAYLIDNLL